MQSQAQYAALPVNGAPPIQHPSAHHLPPPHAPAPYHPHQYAYPNGGMQAAPMPSTVGVPGQGGAMMRFPIPVTPGQIAGGRQKKDIKRRTKTGCLTCRKRRIKCDEGHPTCRNCQKSKRDCLGYDPIFKQQPGHALIQPAPATSSPTTPTVPSTDSPASDVYPPAQSYAGARGSYAAATVNPSHPLDGTFGYATSLDPALSGGHHHQALPMATNNFGATLHPQRTVKPIAMDQLFSPRDIPPKYPTREASPPHTSISQQEIDDFYRFHFAQGLDRLFETKWYSLQGLTHLQRDHSLIDFIVQCMEQFKSQDPTATAMVQSLEARLVWQLANMPRAVYLDSRANGTSNDQYIIDLLPRIDTVEYLLTGQYLPLDRIPPMAVEQTSAVKYNEQHFWHQLGTFTSLRDDSPDPLIGQAIDDALNNMRGILGMMENRDVLYSLAIARHIGGRMSDFHPRQPLSCPEDANDDVHKLEVARRFVEFQDQRGTTQVIQRICGMAMRSWTLHKQ